MNDWQKEQAKTPNKLKIARDWQAEHGATRTVDHNGTEFTARVIEHKTLSADGARVILWRQVSVNNGEGYFVTYQPTTRSLEKRVSNAGMPSLEMAGHIFDSFA